MLQTALTIVNVLLVACAAWVVALRRQRVSLLLDREEVVAQNESLRVELGAMRTAVEVTRERQRAAEELLTTARESFKALAGDVLKDSQDRFLQLAEQRLRVEQGKAGEQLEARQKAIEQLVKPVNETLEKYNVSLREIEKSRSGAYDALMKDLDLFRADQRRLREETGNLVKALRRPEVRGRWGEMQLRRVVEMAGMVEHCDFTEQATVGGEDGRLRPDMVVRLPSNRVIVIDAKTPIDAYMDAMECGDEAERSRCLARHVEQIEGKVRELTAKGYGQQFERTPDFVVLFIPGESFLQPAMQAKPTLMENAMAQKVVIATPSTLVALLRIIALGWREEKLSENAEQISQAGKELHERLCKMAEHLAKVGASLGKAVEGYNGFVKSLDSRVVPSIKRLEELHARSPDELPELPEVAVMPLASRALPLIPLEVEREA